MSLSTSNIEPLARDICERDFRRAGIPQESLSAVIPLMLFMMITSLMTQLQSFNLLALV